jgi:hypothetical protein
MQWRLASGEWLENSWFVRSRFSPECRLENGGPKERQRKRGKEEIKEVKEAEEVEEMKETPGCGCWSGPAGRFVDDVRFRSIAPTTPARRDAGGPVPKYRRSSGAKILFAKASGRKQPAYPSEKRKVRHPSSVMRGLNQLRCDASMREQN